MYSRYLKTAPIAALLLVLPPAACDIGGTGGALPEPGGAGEPQAPAECVWGRSEWDECSWG